MSCALAPPCARSLVHAGVPETIRIPRRLEAVIPIETSVTGCKLAVQQYLGKKSTQLIQVRGWHQRVALRSAISTAEAATGSAPELTSWPKLGTDVSFLSTFADARCYKGHFLGYMHTNAAKGSVNARSTRRREELTLWQGCKLHCTRTTPILRAYQLRSATVSLPLPHTQPAPASSKIPHGRWQQMARTLVAQQQPAG